MNTLRNESRHRLWLLSRYCCIRSLVRRFISISLLLLLILPLASPLFAASTTDAEVPVCCRRDGKHHCMMAKVAKSLAGDSVKAETVTFQERCPYNLASPAAVNLPFVPDEIQARVSADTVCNPVCAVPSEAHLHIVLDRSHQKRGPPSLILYRS